MFSHFLYTNTSCDHIIIWLPYGIYTCMPVSINYSQKKAAIGCQKVWLNCFGVVASATDWSMEFMLNFDALNTNLIRKCEANVEVHFAPSNSYYLPVAAWKNCWNKVRNKEGMPLHCNNPDQHSPPQGTFSPSLHLATYFDAFTVPDASYLRGSNVFHSFPAQVSVKVGKDICSTTAPLPCTTHVYFCRMLCDGFMHIHLYVLHNPNMDVRRHWFQMM